MTSFESHHEKMLDKGFDAEVDGMTSPQSMPQGDRALYRAIFRGMQVHGLPEKLTVAGVTMRFQLGPALVQKTDLSQRAGYPLVFDKSMSRGVLVGEGHWLTLVEVGIDSYANASKEAIANARQRAESAVAFVAAILDERLGQEMLAENMLIFDGEKPVAVADLRNWSAITCRSRPAMTSATPSLRSPTSRCPAIVRRRPAGTCAAFRRGRASMG
jgi:hypothetical protein